MCKMIKAYKFFLLPCIFLLVNCGQDTCQESVFSNIEAIKHKDNNLRFDILVETSLPGRIRINYWQDNNKENVFSSALSADSVKHSVVLSALSPEKNYSFSVALETADCQIESKPYKFVTGQVPANLTPLTWGKFDSTALNGYLLLQRRTPRGNVHLINGNGEIVWYQKVEGMVKVSHWTERNTALVLYGNDQHKNSAGGDIVEYNLSGQKLLHLNLEEKGYTAHHEVGLDPVGNVVMLIYDTRIMDLTPIGGKANQSITGDGILIMDKTGKELWKWSVFDHKNPLSDPNLLEHPDDWGHANALSYDSDGNILLSMRDWNQVWKVNAKTGEVIWKFGQDGDFGLDRDLYFSGQHAIHVNPAGHYMLFDNGRAERKSRVLSFSIDEARFVAKPQMVIDMQDEFYADRMGSAYLMDNDNIVVCSPRARSILVFSPKGEILCNAYVGIPEPYRVEFVRSSDVTLSKPD